MTSVVPRPPSARPGAPAPWAGVPARARRRLGLARVRRAFSEAGRAGGVDQSAAGPGRSPSTVALGAAPAPAQVPASAVLPPAGAPEPTAAVLVAMFEEDGEVRVVLTRRSANLRSHRGEVAFPGGRVEPGERLVAAALREAEEEIGLSPASVDPVGWLYPLTTYSSGTWISPVVGALPGRPVTVPNPAEVARVFDVALADLLADGVFHEERWTRPGLRAEGSGDGQFPVHFYEVATETVWGATGRMLTDLLSVVLGVGG